MNDLSDVLLDIDKSAETRIQAVFQLLSMGKGINAIIDALFNDPNPIVRHECAYCLGEMNNEAGNIALIKSIETDTNRFVVHEAALAVANTRYINSQHVIEELLNNDDTDIVDTAEIALQRLKGKTEFKDPFIAISDDVKETRIQATFSLLDMNSEEAVDTLISRLFVEKSPIVKHEIVFALGETASNKATDALTHTLQTDTNAFVVHECLLSLATLGDSISENTIKKYIDHKDNDIAISASIALDRIQSVY